MRVPQAVTSPRSDGGYEWAAVRAGEVKWIY